MFLPKTVLSKICLVQRTHGARSVPYDIKRWMFCAAKQTEAIVKKNFHEKLLRVKVIGRVDIKKISRIFGGWGKEEGSKEVDVYKKKIAALELVEAKAKHYRREEEIGRARTWEWQSRIARTRDSFKKLLDVKKEYIEETWRRRKLKQKRSLEWMINGKGGVKINDIGGRRKRDKVEEMWCPSDEVLIEKIGQVEDKPIVYGGVELNSREETVLCLPPKYAVTEHLNLKELKLEIKRASMKGRWNQRSREENDEEDMGEEEKREKDKKEVLETSQNDQIN